MRTEGSPHTAASVVFVSLDGDVEGMVREALAAEAVLPNSSVDFGEGIDIVLRSLPDVVLVGMDEDPGQAVEFARILTKEKTKSTLIAVSGTRDADVILSAMRAGFAEYVVLPDDMDQLRYTVHGAAFKRQDDEGKGLVVSVLGAKGGVGTTLVATHLSAELAGIHRVLCMDMVFGKGDIAPAMDIVAKDTIADLLPRASTVDERMINGTVFVHPSKVHFLCQPDDIDLIEAVDADAIYNIVGAASQGYQYVIMDNGSVLDDATLASLALADQILVVATPDVVAVRDAHRMLKALTAAGIERQRVHVVLNKVPKQPYLTQDTIESNLGVRIVGAVQEDARRVSHAVNEGKLLRDLHPRAEIVTEIGRLVGLLSEDPDDLAPVAETTEKKGLLSRFFSR